MARSSMWCLNWCCCVCVNAKRAPIAALQLSLSLGTSAASQVTNSTVYAWGHDISNYPASGTENGGLVGGKGKTIGVARTRAFEHGTGTESTVITGAYDRADKFQHYLFDKETLLKC